MRHWTKPKPQFFLGGRGGAAPAVPPLRFATNSNFAPTQATTLSGTRLHVKSRIGFRIGAADRSSLVVSFFNWLLATSGVTLGANAFTVQACALEKDGAASSVPVTFSGGRTLVVASGDTDVHSDELDPADFGESAFVRGDLYWLRMHISVSTAGHVIPQGIPYFGSRGGAFPAWVGWAYDPAENATTASIDAVGNLTLGNGVGTGVTAPYMPVILGRVASADAPIWIGTGTSIMDTAADTLTGYGFAGFFHRALVNSALDGDWGAGMNFGCSSARSQMWQGANVDKATAYWAYANRAVDEFGTNSVFISDSQADMRTNSQLLWALMNAEGIGTIVRTKIIPRTTSTDSWATAANQTPLSEFGAGQKADLYNDWLDTRVGIELAAVVPMDSVRDAGDQWKWITNGTPNYPCDLIGTHPTAATHIFMANELRAEMANFA